MTMKLYAFITPEIAKHAGFLKIGETYGDVEQRVKQQGHELNVKREIVWQDAVMTDRVNIDKMLHRFLVRQGFPIQQFDDTGHDTEWVKCTVGDLEKAFAALKEQLYQDEILRQAVTDEFYLKIRNWYYWTVGTNPGINSEYALRLVVRLLFCFFLREKDGLVPKELFDDHFLKEHLKDNEYRYYNAVLRHLFFRCLNTPTAGRRGEKLEHEKLFKNVRALKEQFAKIPFLNGGIFNEHEGDEIPLNDDYFFSDERTRHLPELGGNLKVWGLVRILSQYEYKLSLDDLLDHAEYAQTIDPEFIGKVFESLLACIDAESDKSRRKVTGSYYTPREIVDYMVCEALDAAIQTADSRQQTAADTNVERLLSIRILDPACGSGAFPCGIMNEIMRRLDPERKLTQSERYRRKLEIIRKVIYGVDIQSIAVQITQLRLFLSLIQEIVPDKRKENYGIEPLPNLETKFVCANTLIGLKKKEKNGQGRLELPIVKETIKQLRETRSQHFMASGIQEKERLRKYDEALRKTLGIAMEDAGDLTHDTAEKLVAWNPYNQSHSSPFFDSVWMFGIEKFDIVIGNPPYGATYPAENKDYFLKNYKSAKTTTINGGNEKIQKKGSLDTFSLFIENGFNRLTENGYLAHIVPITVVSSDSMTALHELLFDHCKMITVSSYAKRPVQIFRNACVANTIISFFKTNTKCERILTTKMNRLIERDGLKKLLGKLKFTEARRFCMRGRIPKISLSIEKKILKKLFTKGHTPIRDLVDADGKPVYYRSSGGRYFNVVTNYLSESTKEKPIFLDPKFTNTIGAILSSNLFWWYQQVYSNGLDLKSYEIESFPIPVDALTAPVRRKIEKLYERYLQDIERNVVVHETKEYKHVTQYKEYKIRYSKELIDAIDDVVCPLYGLTDEELEFIKNYELRFRTDE